MSDQQALSGLKILDFTQVLAGPFATQQLAQLGAQVIKIEQPGSGDITRAGLVSSAENALAPSFVTCNLGKRSLALDLKHEAAKDIIFSLARESDAVVENFKPGTIERLGFGYDAITAINPNVVYASISGYGQEGPMSELPAFDGAIQAASGMMSISGHEETGPVRTGYFSVDMSTALNAAFAITAALFRRHVTGEGQRIDVAMMDTAFVMQASQVTSYLANGTMPDLLGNRSPTKQPTANVFATSDGYIQVVGLKDAHAQAICEVIGAPELFDAHPEARSRVKATSQFNAALEPAFKSNTTQYWLDTLADVGVPAAPIRDIAAAINDPQNEHRLITSSIDSYPAVSASHVAQPAPPIVQGPAPQLGQHTQEVLQSVGLDQETIRQLAQEGAIEIYAQP